MHAAPRFCPLCRSWEPSDEGTCPRVVHLAGERPRICGADLGDELAVGLPVEVAQTSGRRTRGWSRAERFRGVVTRIGEGAFPVVYVRTEGGEERTAWIGGIRPDTASARAAEGVRGLLTLLDRLSSGADDVLWARQHEALSDELALAAE